MSKRVTKTQVVLNEAKMRVDEAEMERNEARTKLDHYQARYEAYLEAYQAMEVTLARRPKSPSPAPSAGKKSKQQKSLPTATVANIEGEMANVSSASKKEKDVDYGGTIDLH